MQCVTCVKPWVLFSSASITPASTKLKNRMENNENRIMAKQSKNKATKTKTDQKN